MVEKPLGFTQKHMPNKVLFLDAVKSKPRFELLYL